MLIGNVVRAVYNRKFDFHKNLGATVKKHVIAIDQITKLKLKESMQQSRILNKGNSREEICQNFRDQSQSILRQLDISPSVIIEEESVLQKQRPTLDSEQEF